MSEPRKLNTGNAHQTEGQTPARPVRPIQRKTASDQYAEARRQAQAAASKGARQRRVAQPVRPTTQQLDRIAAQRRAEEEAARKAQAAKEAERAARKARAEAEAKARAAEAAAREEARAKPLTAAQRQALALQRATKEKYGDTLSFQVQRPPEERRSGIQFTGDLPRQAPRRAASAPKVSESQERGARQLFDYDDYDDEPKPAPKEKARPAKEVGRKGKTTHKKAAADGDGPVKAGRKKKKGGWWKVLLITVLALGLIFGGTYLFIMNALRPAGSAISLDKLINTPKEFQDDEFNFLVVGIDRSSAGSADGMAAGADVETGDGNTDMMLWCHFNNVTGEFKMIQFPRDIMYSADKSVTGNYRINNIAKTQATEPGTMNVPALCDALSEMYQIPIDAYITIKLEMLVALVDLYNGVELYVPQDMEYGGSYLKEGFRRLDGAAVEFMLRTRKIYPDGDIGRLRTQRQFYAAMFRLVKNTGNPWDLAKLATVALNYVETDMSFTELSSLAVSMLKLDTSKIMICTMPVLTGSGYQGASDSQAQAVLFAARQEDADLLNTYFRENTGPVDASALKLCLPQSDVRGPINYGALSVTDPSITSMGTLVQDAQAAQAEAEANGEHFETTYTEATPDPNAAAESQPAA